MIRPNTTGPFRSFPQLRNNNSQLSAGTDLEAALQQQVSHAVGVLVQLVEGPPLAGALEDQSRLVAVALHRLGEDLWHGVPLAQVTLDVPLHPQQHVGRAEGDTHRGCCSFTGAVHKDQILTELCSFNFDYHYVCLGWFFLNLNHLLSLSPGGEPAREPVWEPAVSLVHTERPHSNPAYLPFYSSNTAKFNLVRLARGSFITCWVPKVTHKRLQHRLLGVFPEDKVFLYGRDDDDDDGEHLWAQPRR